MNATPSTWWSRNWKWCVPVGCLSALAAFVGIILLIMVLILRVIRGTDVYQEAVQKASTHPAVIEALGSPLEQGWFPTGNINTSGPTGEANLAIPLKGPKGKGTLYVEARRSAGQWHYHTLLLEIQATGERLDLK